MQSHAATITNQLLVAAVKYAKLVKEFANLPDGRGANHALLASFLGKLLLHWSATLELPQQEECFALSYTFSECSAFT